jgi:hypothetical protein
LKHHANPDFWACERFLLIPAQVARSMSLCYLRDPATRADSRRWSDWSLAASVLATALLKASTAMLVLDWDAPDFATSCSANARI